MRKLFSGMKERICGEVDELVDEKEEKNGIAWLNQYLGEWEEESEKVREVVEREERLKEEFNGE
ncbi:hypothetical protein [Priestia megaterium]|uniref:hypothetical protein n=1 Tax=Priestia megaterium TaxID=1404 RepID=UPI0012B95EAF|nr:hypothetical protein [Priestia megaterium]